MGAFRIPNDNRPTGGAYVMPSEKTAPPKAIILQELAKPPAGTISSAECARRLGMADSTLRTMRARNRGEDRGPACSVLNQMTVYYWPQDVQAYADAKLALAKQRAALARETPEEESARLKREADALR